MSITVQQVNTAANSDTWSIALSRLNQVINAISTQVLTTAANSSGSITVGNAHVAGYLSSTLFATNTLRGGNVATSNVLVISSNVSISTGNNLTIGNSSVNTYITEQGITANVGTFQSINVISFSLQAVQLGNSTLSYMTSTTTGTTSQIIDSFLLSSIRSAEYTLSVKNNVANGYQFTKISVIHDGTAPYSTEYGTIISNTNLGAFAFSANATHALLFMTPTAANTTIKGTRLVIGT